MVWTCVDSALEELAWLESDSRKKFPIANQIQASQLELRFLKMFFGCLAKWEDASLGSEMVSIESALKEAGQGLYAAGLIAIHKRKVTDWNILTKNLMEKVEEFKPLIGEKCIAFLGCSMQCKTSTSDEILEFFDSIFKNLEDLVNSKVSVVTCLQRQIGSIQEKIKLFRNFADFISKRCIEHEKLEHLLDHIQIWANYVSCLSILYWINEMDEILERRMHVLLSDVMQKIKPCTLQVTGLYIEALKASKSPRSDTFLMGKVVGRFVDFLLENLVITLRDRVEIFREGLIFLITFLMDPPEENAEDELIFTQVDALTSQAASVICSLHVDDLKEGLSMERSIVLSDFLEEINKVKADVGMHHVQVLTSLQSNFPWTNATGFVDSLLENVKKMLQVKANFIPFPKHRVETVHGELESVRSSLTDIMELQNKHEELKDLWTRVINVVYHAEHVIDSCLIADNPIWYNILCLSKVIEEIKLARRDVQKIGDEQMYNMQNLNARAKFSHAHPSQPNTSSIDEVIVGFKDEAETIIDRLTRGSKQLDIVSLAGMPGLGKTTLAKKIYNDPSVQYHFNKCAWCYVSQEYKSRELLLSILHDIGGINDKISEMGIDDLVEHLWRCLKGQRYLIVLDDIWDIKAWDILKGSFPDDYKGSRIVFTSRNHNLSSLAKPDCSPHLLRLFSDEESWELLQQKLFHKDGCPPTFSVIGEQIAKNCKGLPLAVAVIAGLLARTDFDINWWKHVAHSLSSRLADEGCLDILELSYKYLPDYLKPCFLYLGAFRHDKVIKVQKLSQLWIAEGFIKKSGVKCLEDVAEEYLNDLISRSLIIVRDRSSKGGIKTCHLHDLLRDLCLSKVKEENFLQALDESAVSNYSSNPRMYDQYRLCIHSEWEPFMESRPTGQYVHSLLWSADYSWKQHFDVSSLFNSFKFLHVLDMVTIFLNCSFPEEITLVVHLTYLAIRGYVRYVPTTIANLWNLQTLIVKEGGYDVFLPKTIWMMKSLRHVDIRSIHSIDFSDSKLESSPLDNIMTFSSPILTCGEDTEELLRRLPRLQKLSCIFSAPNDVPCRKRFQFPMLGSLTELHSLKVTGLFFHFKKLDKIPPFNFPETLKKLTLSSFRLPWIAISRIGKLPNLEVLKLHDEAFDGKTWEVEDGEFVNLKFLKLYRLNIKQLNVPTEPFPCLQRLVVQDCDRLKEIPSSIGDILSMKVIQVYWSSYTAANSARRILEEQREMGNEGLEVHIIN